MTQTAVAARLPDWLQDPRAIAWHRPTQTLFVPQRVLRRTQRGVCLVDFAEQEYLLRECECPRIEHLQGIAVFVTESGEAVSVYRDYAEPGAFLVADGVRKARFKVDESEVARAAQSLARAFDGAIVTEEDLSE